jgi:S-adenosylmethionine hydrolase
VTDFGTRDHYVAAMKAVALGICRDASLVDITHEIGAQDVLGGAIELAACCRYFPSQTVFVAVIDPGVGSARRAIAAAAGAYTFVAPDNGVLTMVFDELPVRQVVELTEARYTLPVVSRTFEGRDRFAPAAAWIATGIELPMLGPPIDPATLTRLPVPSATLHGDVVRGEVVWVDRFGNLVTNIRELALQAVGPPAELIVRIDTGHSAAVVATYAAAGNGALCALIGSSGHLELAVNGGSAAAFTGAARGAAVHVARGA